MDQLVDDGFARPVPSIQPRTPGSTAANFREVQSLIEERLAEIGQRLNDLRHVQRVLKSSLEKYKKTDRSNCCHVIETLREATK